MNVLEMIKKIYLAIGGVRIILDILATIVWRISGKYSDMLEELGYNKWWTVILKYVFAFFMWPISILLGCIYGLSND